jgi:hypothetical protein
MLNEYKEAWKGVEIECVDAKGEFWRYDDGSSQFDIGCSARYERGTYQAAVIYTDDVHPVGPGQKQLESEQLATILGRFMQYICRPPKGLNAIDLVAREKTPLNPEQISLVSEHLRVMNLTGPEVVPVKEGTRYSWRRG